MRWTALLTSLSILGACQTTPEPCTAEWIDWKTDRILSQFAAENSGEVRRLRDFSQTLQQDNIGPLTALQIPGMIEDFKTLASAFEGSVLPELNAAVEQCGSAQDLAPAFVSFLRDEGVGEDVLEWVELLAVIAIET